MAIGRPLPFINWTNNGTAIVNNSTVLIYRQLMTEGGITFVRSILQTCATNSNNYRCIANNTVGVGVFNFGIDLNLEGKCQLINWFIDHNQLTPHLAVQKILLAQGIIQESSSLWMASAVFVRKKSVEIHLCVDYRELNKKTSTDAYPLPLPVEVQDQLAGAKLFTALDLQCGYWQMPVNPTHHEKSAVCPGPVMGLFQFRLSNAIWFSRSTKGRREC